MSQSVGLNLLASIAVSGDLKNLVSLHLDAEVFKPSEQEVYAFIINHVKCHGVLPALTTIAADMGHLLEVTTEPPSYYADQVRDRYLTRALSTGLKDANDLLKAVQPQEALALLSSVVTDMIVKQNANAIFDFRDSADPIHQEYQEVKKGGDMYGITTGWPSLDEMMGGLFGGDVMSIVGRPAMGKTFKLLKTAHHVWHTQKKTTMLISTEMTPLLLMQRVAAMHVHKNLTMLKQASYSTKVYNQIVNELKGLKSWDVPFWIIDGKLTATVDDIWLMARQLQPEAIWIDGAYLLKSKNPNAKKWEKITDTAEGVKDLATDLGIPAICSYQLNRDATSKKKDEAPGLENIAGTDAIGQLSSVVLGLLEHDTVETINKRKVSILKGRNGEVGEFLINWDFNLMNFSESIEPKVGELQFL